MTNTPQQPPAGWYPDPAGSGGERFWDGGAWSQSTRDKPAPAPAPDAPSSYGAPGGAQYGSQQYGSQQYGQQQYQQQYGQSYGGYAQGYQGDALPRPAGFWWRFLGYVIDGIVLSIATNLLSRVFGINAMMDRAMEAYTRELLLWSEAPESAPFPMPGDDFFTASLYLSGLALVLWIAYRIGMYAWKSATLGQMAVGLRLVKADDWDAKLSMGTIVTRAVASSVLYSLTLVNVVNGLAAAFSSKKQTLGDMIARTQVLKIR